MSRVTGVLFLVSILVAACGGAAAPTAAPGVPTQAPGQPTAPPAQVTPAPAPGGTTVSVTLTGGADPGTYTGTENPNCSFGLVAPGVWGTQYSTATAGAGQLSSVQTVIPPEGESDTNLLMTVTIGPLFQGNDYELNEDTGSATVNDGGATAVIHMTGTTEDGVGMDVTVNCPAVMRF